MSGKCNHGNSVENKLNKTTILCPAELPERRVRVGIT